MAQAAGRDASAKTAAAQMPVQQLLKASAACRAAPHSSDAAWKRQGGMLEARAAQRARSASVRARMRRRAMRPPTPLLSRPSICSLRPAHVVSARYVPSEKRHHADVLQAGEVVVQALSPPRGLL